jgi:hypothetical protein
MEPNKCIHIYYIYIIFIEVFPMTFQSSMGPRNQGVMFLVIPPKDGLTCLY